MIDKLQIRMVNKVHMPTNDLEMEVNYIIEANIRLEVYKSIHDDRLMIGVVIDGIKEDTPSDSLGDLCVDTLSIADIYDKIGELGIMMDIKRGAHTYRRIIRLEDIFQQQDFEEIDYNPIKLLNIKAKIDGSQLTTTIEDKDNESYTYKFMLD